MPEDLMPNPIRSLTEAVELSPPWTDEEKERISEIARRRMTAAEVEALFPGRSLKAIRKQISAARRGMGIATRKCTPKLPRVAFGLSSDDPGFDDTAQRDAAYRAAARSNQMYLAALARAGYLVQVA